MNLVEVKGVTKHFGRKRALAGLDFALPAGKHLLLTGPSGCGKSTLLRIIAGLEAPDAGSVALEGERVTDGRKILVPPHRRGVAMVFQDLGLWPNLSVRDNVLLAVSGLRLSNIERVSRADDALERCGVLSLASEKPGRLSGGEQQRVALARGLAVRPRLLLLDEPFTAIDLVLRQALVEHLRQILAAQTTLIWVSHDPFDARAFDAEVVVLEDGAIRERGPLESLCATPQSRTMTAWVASRRGAQ